MQNRISTVSGATSPVHSANGEMTTDETGQTLKYDAWGRLVEVNTDGQGAAEITYAYDALHRRIERNSNEFYYTAEWQQIEERDAQGVEAQFVWSPVYIDAMVLRDRDSDNDGTMEATDERLYVVHDANFNITALLAEDGTWQVVERFIYDAYGTRSVLDANWSVDADNLSDVGFDSGHHGGRHDLNAGLVYFRFRDLDTSLGRWITQDPLRHVAGLNLYEAYGSSPSDRLDPTGEFFWKAICCTTLGVLAVKRFADAVNSRLCSGLQGVDLLLCHLGNILDIAGITGLKNCMAKAMTKDTLKEKFKAAMECFKQQGLDAVEDIAVWASFICCLGLHGLELIKKLGPKLIPTPKPVPVPAAPVTFCDTKITDNFIAPASAGERAANSEPLMALPS